MDTGRLKIVVESHIPYIRGVFERTGVDVSYLAPEQITPETVRDADALVVRTRTRCNSELLEGSICRVIATATIGTDHIDLDWCRSKGITVVSAPGCNAPAVAQYVCGCLQKYAPDDIKRLKVGVVGVGHVGKIVSSWVSSLGAEVMECDPPRQIAEGGDFKPLRELMESCDAVTLHTPLTKEGRFPTYHIINREILSHARKGMLLINAARGAVIDMEAVKEAAQSGDIQAAIDCWEGEPDIDRSLLESAFIATPHIAGYSKEGKFRATAMAVEGVCRGLGLPLPEINTAAGPLPVPCSITTAELCEAAARLDVDTAELRKVPSDFEKLRNGYNLRTEPGQTKTPDELMQDAGIKITPIRTMVIRSISSFSSPVSAQQIEDNLETVDRSSITRALALFVKRGLLHVVEDGSGSSKYELCHNPASHGSIVHMHPHFHCKECGKTECLESTPIPDMKLPEGYMSESANFVIKGLCARCAGKRK